MALVASSSPGRETYSGRYRGPLLAPSSPTAAYLDGQLSPSLDASFASSMSIGSDTAASHGHFFDQASSPHLMDISPAPSPFPPSMLPLRLSRPPVFRAKTSGNPPLRQKSSSDSIVSKTRVRSTTGNDYPFLRNAFSATTEDGGEGHDDDAPRSASPVTFLGLVKETSPNPFVIGTERTGHGYEERRFDFGVGDDAAGEQEDSGSETTEEEQDIVVVAPGRLRSLLPAWGGNHSEVMVGGLRPPPSPLVKRSSAPTLVSGRDIESSPVRMDIDSPASAIRPSGLHPRSGRPIRSNSLNTHTGLRRTESTSESVSTVAHSPDDPSDSRLADLFNDNLSPSNFATSPKRNNRKRILDHELSPTPACASSPTPPSGSGTSSLSLAFGLGMKMSGGPSTAIASRKSSSSSLSSHVARRRPSQNSLAGASKRPPLSSAFSMIAPSTTVIAGGVTTFKRHAQALNGKPAAPKINRRAYSVADASGGGMFTDRDRNIADGYHPSTSKMDGYFQTLGRKTGTGVSMDGGTVGANSMREKQVGSPLTGFRSQETKGKALPCFGVKEDGLMRITSDTLNRLQKGDYTNTIARYLIIDCRFSYEFDGGHITEAVNLPTTVEVETALLGLECLPLATTSEDMPPPGGKTVLVFHCEFSAKRAPTSAKHLRSKDRLLNTAEYPRVHYPEVYILQGGYADFHGSFPDKCDGGYLPMDAPEHNAKRSVDLHAFRQQSRQFNRASSFTFGQASSASAMLKAASSRPPLARTNSLAPTGFVFPAAARPEQGMSITEEEHESAGDSSFNAGSSPGGGGDSPCPTSKAGAKGFMKNEMGAGRRILGRAQTAVSMFHRG